MYVILSTTLFQKALHIFTYISILLIYVYCIVYIYISANNNLFNLLSINNPFNLLSRPDEDVVTSKISPVNLFTLLH